MAEGGAQRWRAVCISSECSCEFSQSQMMKLARSCYVLPRIVPLHILCVSYGFCEDISKKDPYKGATRFHRAPPKAPRSPVSF